MSPINIQTLAQFAALNSKSAKTEIDGAVQAVAEALATSVRRTQDRRDALRDISEFLTYLQQLKGSRHPGRVALATAIADQVLPLLYAPEPDHDRYPYQREEDTVAAYAARWFERSFAYIRAEDESHPRHGSASLPSFISPFVFFSPDAGEGVKEALKVLFAGYMRNVGTEKNLYQKISPLIEDEAKIDLKDFNERIRNMIDSAIAQAQRAHRTAASKRYSQHAQAQSISADSTTSATSPHTPASPDSVVLTSDELTALEALEAMRLHGRRQGYFVPQELDYEALNVVLNLDQAKLRSALFEISNALSSGEGESYVARQIDRLDDTHTLVLYDITVLSAFFMGDRHDRVSFKQMHDACLGAAKSKQGMAQIRPLIMAELCRRPHQLAQQLMRFVDDQKIDADLFRDLLDAFMQTLSALNGRRFEQEIFGCLSLIWGHPVFYPLIAWIQDDNRAEHNMSSVREKIIDLRIETCAA